MCILFFFRCRNGGNLIALCFSMKKKVFFFFINPLIWLWMGSALINELRNWDRVGYFFSSSSFSAPLAAMSHGIPFYAFEHSTDQLIEYNYQHDNFFNSRVDGIENRKRMRSKKKNTHHWAWIEKGGLNMLQFFFFYVILSFCSFHIEFMAFDIKWRWKRKNWWWRRRRGEKCSIWMESATHVISVNT